VEPEQPSTGDTTTDEPAGLSVGDPDLGKTRLLTRPCDTCIFHAGNPMHLGADRLREFVDRVRAEQSFIICHDTLPHHRYPDAKPAICRGFYQRYTTQTLRLIQRLWGFTEVDPPS
jgi:hypothetical protein